MPDHKPCIRCGKPRPEKAKKYCAACAKKRNAETWRDYYYRKMGRKPPQKKRSAPKKKPTPEELEAEARARSSNGWIKADVVICRGCQWYSTETWTCDYIWRTGRERPDPKDCYRHEGTPYRAKGG